MVCPHRFAWVTRGWMHDAEISDSIFCNSCTSFRREGIVGSAQYALKIYATDSTKHGPSLICGRRNVRGRAERVACNKIEKIGERNNSPDSVTKKDSGAPTNALIDRAEDRATDRIVHLDADVIPEAHERGRWMARGDRLDRALL